MLKDIRILFKGKLWQEHRIQHQREIDIEKSSNKLKVILVTNTSVSKQQMKLLQKQINMLTEIEKIEKETLEDFELQESLQVQKRME